MKIKLCSFFIVFAILQIILPIVNAEVRTEKTSDENSVCIAGNRNFYPVEYYNSETKQFEGVIPEILKRVSRLIPHSIEFEHFFKKLEANDVYENWLYSKWFDEHPEIKHSTLLQAILAMNKYNNGIFSPVGGINSVQI